MEKMSPQEFYKKYNKFKNDSVISLYKEEIIELMIKYSKHIHDETECKRNKE